MKRTAIKLALLDIMLINYYGNMNPKLYQNLTEKQLEKFLKENGTSLCEQKLTEIKDEEADFFGDFLVFGGYKFKLTFGWYVCMETPKEKHKKQKQSFIKAPNDNYTNWKTKI